MITLDRKRLGSWNCLARLQADSSGSEMRQPDSA